MLFKPELVRLILAGKKTQTRRIARGDSYYRERRNYPLERVARRDEMTNIEKARMDRPNPRMRGRPPRVRVAMLSVVEVRTEPLKAMSFEDARAEGFRLPADFRRYWLALHDRSWPPVEHAPCTGCLGDPDHPSDEQPCELCAGEEWFTFRAHPDDAEVQARFDDRHGDTLVHVITFDLVREHSERFLAEDSSIGYVDRLFDDHGRRIALAGEPEALTAAEHEQHIAKPAREREMNRRADVVAAERRLRENLAFEERMVRAQRAARMRHINISSELKAFEAARRQGRGEQTEERRLQALEAKAYPEAA